MEPDMDQHLFFSALTKAIFGFLLLAALLFLPAGTVHWFNAWLLMVVLFLPMLVLGVFLLWKSPELLRKRLNTGEKEPIQRKIILGSVFMFLGGFLAAGFSFRFGVLLLPRWVSFTAAAVFLAGYGLYARVLRENAFLSRTVEVQEGQTVISTGLYAVVRHPMYAATILLFLSMPLVLGSMVSFCFFLPYPILIAKRIENEEAVLTNGLPGYSAYKERVTYRLFPFVW